MLGNRRTATLLVAALALFSVPASANLITNPGFETGDFTGWTQFGNVGFTGVSGSFSGIDPTEGSFQAFFGPVGSTGGISQTVTGGAGQYLVSFDLHNAGGTPSFFDVSFGGTSLQTFTDPGAFPYTSFSFLTTAPVNPTLAFTFQHDPNYFLLDNVSVESVVPEPASLLFLGTGLAAVARRRFKQRA